MSVLNIGIAGLGTLGQAMVNIIAKDAVLLAKRSGREIKIIAVSSHNKNKKRDCDVSAFRWVDNAADLANIAEIDVVVELIGGASGIAKDTVEAALKAGKHVVTANKALIAEHGVALAKLAEQKGVMLAFEAAVAGGIPALKVLKQGLAANHISKVCGILNGTCNYILTHMWNDKRDFADVLAEAQKLGYAEADPSFDVDAIDTSHKLAILTSLAFGVEPNLQSLTVEGIRHITLRDMEFADELGYVVKLLGIAEKTDAGILQRVHPCMVAKDSAIANVSGVFNAVQMEGNCVGSLFLEGRGAGGMPTSSAILADVIDIARGTSGAPFGVATGDMTQGKFLPLDFLQSSYYIRLNVLDKPGVLADITSVFRDNDISLKSFLQHGHAPGEQVFVVIATHATSEANMQKALALIAKQANIKEPPFSIRIETV